MAFSFKRSKKIGPFRIGISKSGLSMSAGVKGLRVGANSKGTYTTVSVPGTGISSTSYAKKEKKPDVPVIEKKQSPSLAHKPLPSGFVKWTLIIVCTVLFLPLLFIVAPGLVVLLFIASPLIYWYRKKKAK